MNKVLNIKELLLLPKLTVYLDTSDEGKGLYSSFSSRHPKYKIIGFKKYGVGIIDLNLFGNFDSYLKKVNGKNSAAYFSRKAQRDKMMFAQFNPSEFTDSILEINQSSQVKQGRKMDSSYLKKLDYPINEHNFYFAIFHHGKLVAYLWLVVSGELGLVNRILGQAQFLDSGIMYLIVTSTVEYVMKKIPQVKYIMYDTIFGASEGLKLFKKRCGFNPYKVKWSLRK